MRALRSMAGSLPPSCSALRGSSPLWKRRWFSAVPGGANRPMLIISVQQHLAAQQPPEITGMTVGNIEQGRSGRRGRKDMGCASGVRQRQNEFHCSHRAWRVTVFYMRCALCQEYRRSIFAFHGLTGRHTASRFAPSMHHRPVRLFIPADTAPDRQTRHRSPRWKYRPAHGGQHRQRQRNQVSWTIRNKRWRNDRNQHASGTASAPPESQVRGAAAAAHSRASASHT